MLSDFDMENDKINVDSLLLYINSIRQNWVKWDMQK